MAAILQDQRDAERQHELGIMPLALERRGARACDARDQSCVDEVAEGEQHRAGQHDRDVRAEVATERRLHAERR